MSRDEWNAQQYQAFKSVTKGKPLYLKFLIAVGWIIMMLAWCFLFPYAIIFALGLSGVVLVVCLVKSFRK